MATEAADPIVESIRSELDSIEQQLRQYETLVKRRAQLQAALEVLSGAVAVPSGAGRADAATRPRAARTRSSMSEEARSARIVELVQANPGQHNYKSLADALGVSPATATKDAHRLLESGRIKTNGQERRALRLEPV